MQLQLVIDYYFHICDLFDFVEAVQFINFKFELHLSAEYNKFEMGRLRKLLTKLAKAK